MRSTIETFLAYTAGLVLNVALGVALTTVIH
jgi:hypothetical protein